VKGKNPYNRYYDYGTAWKYIEDNYSPEILFDLLSRMSSFPSNSKKYAWELIEKRGTKKDLKVLKKVLEKYKMDPTDIKKISTIFNLDKGIKDIPSRNSFISSLLKVFRKPN
ncbi:MAG: hypothetical protein WCK31_02270, partial [bacterium]